MPKLLPGTLPRPSMATLGHCTNGAAVQQPSNAMRCPASCVPVPLRPRQAHPCTAIAPHLDLAHDTMPNTSGTRTGACLSSDLSFLPTAVKPSEAALPPSTSGLVSTPNAVTLLHVGLHGYLEMRGESTFASDCQCSVDYIPAVGSNTDPPRWKIARANAASVQLSNVALGICPAERLHHCHHPYAALA